MISSTTNNAVCSASKWLQKKTKNKWLQKIGGGGGGGAPPSESASDAVRKLTWIIC